MSILFILSIYVIVYLIHFPLKGRNFFKIIIMVAICFPLILLHFSRWVWFSFHGIESRETYSLTTQGHIRIFKALRIPQKIPNGIQVVWRFLHLNEVSTLLVCSVCTCTMFFLLGVCFSLIYQFCCICVFFFSLWCLESIC